MWLACCVTDCVVMSLEMDRLGPCSSLFYSILFNACLTCSICTKAQLHGRHLSVSFAVYPTLVLALRVAEDDCKLQLAARPSGRQPAVDLGVKIAAELYLSREWNLKKNHCFDRPVAVEHTQLQRRVLAMATSRFRAVWVDTDCWIA